MKKVKTVEEVERDDMIHLLGFITGRPIVFYVGMTDKQLHQEYEEQLKPKGVKSHG